MESKGSFFRQTCSSSYCEVAECTDIAGHLSSDPMVPLSPHPSDSIFWAGFMLQNPGSWLQLTVPLLPGDPPFGVKQDDAPNTTHTTG